MKIGNLGIRLGNFIGLILMFLISTTILAQQNYTGKITGTVIDNSGALTGAIIRVMKSKDSTLVSGGSADDQGNFSVGIPYGSYKIEISYTGYKKYTKDGITVTSSSPTTSLGTITLSTGDITTEEIEIESSKPQVEITAEKKVVNVENNLVTKGESAIDLLKKIPMVTVDNSNNVVLRGSPNVKLLINGRESPLTDNLDQMPADIVKNIELITNPPAKYSAEGLSGIINIVLKDDEDIGINGGINLGAGTDNKYNGSMNFNLKKGKVTLFGNYFYNSSYNIGNSSASLVNTIPTLTYTNQNDLNNTKRRFQYFSGGLNYQFAKDQTLGLQGFFGFGRFNGSDYGQNNILDSTQKLTQYFTKNNFSNTSGHHYNISANYDGKFKKGEQLSGNLAYSTGEFDNTVNQTLQYYDGNLVPINNTPYKEIDTRNNKHWFFNSSLDFVKPFTKDSKLETGYKGIIRQNDSYYLADTLDYNTNQYLENFGVSNEFKYTEQIYALYAQYGTTFGNFSFKVGLRGEQTFTKGTLMNNDSNFTTDYFSVFPTLNMTQKLTDFEQIQASYSRRINRPGGFRLNPFINRNDPLNISYGNPNLKPEYTDSYELNFVTTFGNTSITPSLFLRHTHDMMTRYIIAVNGDTTTSSFTNVNSSTSYGLDLIASSQIFKWWNLNSTLSFYELTYEGGNIDNFSAPSGFSFKANVSTMISLPKLFNLQLFYNYFGKQYTTQGTVKADQSFDIGVSKQFFDNSLTVLLKANDIFKTLDNNYFISGPGYTQNYTSTYNSRGVFLTLTYNFGQHDNQKGKKKSNNNNPNDIMDEGSN